MKKIGAFFHNGIGNFIIFTSVLKALSYHIEDNIDLFINERWEGEGVEAIKLIAQNLSFVNLKKYPSEFNRKDYESIYLSTHSVFDEAYRQIHDVNKIDVSQFAFWSHSFMSEYDFYYMELIRQFNYKGPLFPQYMPYDENLRIGDESNLRIAVANGFQRSSDNVFQRKQYPYLLEVLNSIGKLYRGTKFYILGGEEDSNWAYDLSNKIDGVRNHTGALNILETASVIKQCDLIICNDSSVYHVADALDKPGVVTMGATLCSKNAPLNKKIIPIRSPLKCAPCQSTFLFKMCEDPTNCMNAITPGLVVAAARRIINDICK